MLVPTVLKSTVIFAKGELWLATNWSWSPSFPVGKILKWTLNTTYFSFGYFLHILSYYILSYYILSYYNLSYYILSYYTLSYYILSYYILSYYILSYYILSYFLKRYILKCTLTLPSHLMFTF